MKIKSVYGGRNPKSPYRVGINHFNIHIMVTYFNRKDLVSFGSYLLSENRKSRFEESYKEAIKQGVDNPLSVEESLVKVYYADVENWLEEQK